ncbi:MULTISPECIES: glycosyltransferase [Pontibacillus]|uniref:Glycosyltransferase family 2 protein n=1 Tax=Pontibacillus chungwhensis TaxID=265426 RepID=A0ABY8USL7_9BACI|nr:MULTISPECIES: glycosyltransferase family 2 protein [Pontibacillus]MCD5323098.1 glycosyltransferase family 2 protein [Pontibacillus sp. HN14]WIF96487.1 glycosyltransferase family 2 protein [Pontibacillus chungwhensis]
MTILLIMTIAFWTYALIDGWRGLKSIKALKEVQDHHSNQFVSIILAAKDEEKAIDQTLQSLINQTHEPFEIIAVNDRSQDQTGSIINKWAKSNPSRIKAIHIEVLPADWLGKNHALYQGTGTQKEMFYYSRMETFTFLTTLLTRPFHSLKRIKWTTFGFGFFKRPWTANKDYSNKGGMGIGAFNMLNRSTYEAIGTHKSFSLRPDDDLYLGQLVKSSGYRQRLVTGMDELSVEWYPSLSTAIKGLEKNTFAGLNYSYSLSFIAVSGTFISQVLPFVIFIVGSNDHRSLSAIAIFLMLALMVMTTRKLTHYHSLYALTLPYSALLFIYTIVRALTITIKNGGIEWRGTFYSLKDLRGKRKSTKQ